MRSGIFRIFTFILILLILGIRCNTSIENKLKTPVAEEQNIFSDPTICKIYTLGYNRETEDLKPFLYDNLAKNKLMALYTTASLQDTSLTGQLAKNLYDANDKVRIMASFALSQLKTEKAAGLIKEAIDFEPSMNVKSRMVVNLGRCGNKQDLDYILDMEIQNNQLLLLEGQARALSYFGVRNVHSVKATRHVLNKLSAPIPQEIKDEYSSYFLRLKGQYFKKFFVQLKKAYYFSSTKGKINILPCFINIPTESTLSFVKQEIEANNDYRIKIQLLNILGIFSYPQIRKELFNAIESKVANIAIKASEILVRKNKNADFENYFDLSQKIVNTRVSANLLRVAMALANNTQKFSGVLVDLYESQDNVYAKADYLQAFSENPLSYKFVSDELFNSQIPVIRSAAILTLSNMCYSDKFDSVYEAKLASGGVDLKKEFAFIFKKAIQTGDAALVSVSADIFTDKKLGLLNILPNTFFFQQAIEDCQLPRDIEAYQALIKTMKIYKITFSTIDYQNSYALLDWSFIRKIPKNQKILIKTNKGDMIIQLMVEMAPATVSSFLKHVLTGYYDNTYVHRAVPNFVVQGGDFRGDGWGTDNKLLRSEFCPLEYDTGILGIASAGKDTESSQWFITLSKTPHLDGKYTIFAKVTKGIEIAHKLEVGDKILSMKML